jgi:hypothetical protein
LCEVPTIVNPQGREEQSGYREERTETYCVPGTDGTLLGIVNRF